MIIDTIGNSRRYRFLPALLAQGLKIASRIKADTPAGVKSYPSGIKVMINDLLTRETDDHLFESHRKYIDIQYLLKGSEIIRWKPVRGLRVASRYSRKKDIALYSYAGKSVSLVMEKGVFAIFFPEDAHQPGLALARPCRVKKVVVKVPASCLRIRHILPNE